MKRIPCSELQVGRFAEENKLNSMHSKAIVINDRY